MSELKVSGISADRPTVRLIADYIGIKNLPGDDIPIVEFSRMADMVNDSGRTAALAVFANDLRDTSTPEAMALLLSKIWKREALSEKSSALLLDIMYRCLTGDQRLKGMLPPNAGHLIAVAFVKESGDAEKGERAIANIGRAAFDYFVFTATADSKRSTGSARVVAR